MHEAFCQRFETIEFVQIQDAYEFDPRLAHMIRQRNYPSDRMLQSASGGDIVKPFHPDAHFILVAKNPNPVSIS